MTRYRVRLLSNGKWIAETRFLGFLWWCGISTSIIGLFEDVYLYSTTDCRKYCFCDTKDKASIS